MTATPENIERGQETDELRRQLLKEIETATFWLGELGEQKRLLELRLIELSSERQKKIKGLLEMSIQEGQGVSRERDELFQRAKMFYEVEHDLQSAVAAADQIPDGNERSRCLVQLAISILQKEGDSAKADRVVERIVDDSYGYKEYYQKEKQRFQK